jgi:acetyl-CoA carboxylase carboxyl transferase subunit alpha
MAANLKKHLLETLDRLADLPAEELLERRYQRLMSYGVFED